MVSNPADAAKPKSKFSFSVSSGKSNSSKGNPSNRNIKQQLKSSSNQDHEEEEEEEDDDNEDEESVDSMDQDDEADTDQEIENSKKVGASKKTAKRKRRATSPTSFGATLQGLLGVPTSSTTTLDSLEEEPDLSSSSKPTKKAKKSTTEQTAILSLAPHLRRSAASTTLNARAARLALDQKRKREERAHVADVIGGWGPPGQLPDEEMESSRLENLDSEKKEKLESSREEWEKGGGTKGYERKLRKVAQRGVVKLFNAIRAAQGTTTDDVQAAADSEGTKPMATLPGGKKQNALGGKESALADLSKSNFLDLIRSGGTGAKKVAAK